MSNRNLGASVASDMGSVMTDYSVAAEMTDGASGHGEFRWSLAEWSEYYGYYKNVPELRTAIDTKAAWVVGAGFEASNSDMNKLSMIKGSGKDSFNSILLNGTSVKMLGGDSYAEIVRDGDTIINLKPLDPGSMVIVYDKKGRIKRYEQKSKNAKYNKRFAPEDIFHLSHNRIADEVHGTSIIPSVEWIILARNEAMSDWKTVLHRNVAPFQIHYLATDNDTQVRDYKSKADAARAKGENMYVPDTTVAKVDVIQSQLNSAASPLQWISQLNDYFFQAVGVPQIVVGNAAEFTDASAKIAYLAFEQGVKAEQLYIEEQVLAQLNIEIELTFPASLQQDLVSGDPANTPLESEPIQDAVEPNDQMAELEGQT